MSLFKKPLILKRNCVNIKAGFKKGIADFYINSTGNSLNQPLFREDVIYESKEGDFLKGDYLSVKLINVLNNLTNTSRTLAKCVTVNKEVVEKTSDNITKLIGHDNYSFLFNSVCSIISQEHRIRAILSILTVPVHSDITTNTQTKNVKVQKPSLKINKASQTNETRLVPIKKRERKRIRRILTPFVVQEQAKPLNKVVIDPVAFKSLEIKKEHNDILVKEECSPAECAQSISEKTIIYDKNNSDYILPDLGFLHDDNTNDSTQTFSVRSFETSTDLMNNPISLLVEKHTIKNPIVLPNYSITLMDNTVIKVPFKPEDIFHIATKQNLMALNTIDRKKLLFLQMQMDFKHCMSLKDEDGNLPIHLAVMNKDIELLKRMCIVLKLRDQSVDIPANNGLTPLKLSLYMESTEATAVLLQYGASPLETDAENRAAAHLAAELDTDHLTTVLHYCGRDARTILMNHAEELLPPDWATQTDDQLATLLIQHVCCDILDKQGSTPLMLASQFGHYRNVQLLVERAPSAVNARQPSSGHTALHLAVAAASTASAGSGNKSKLIDSFRKTIELLLEHGADPTIENHAGANVNDLLQDVNCAELSMLVADKIVHTKFNLDTRVCGNMMLVKNNLGKIDLTPVKTRPYRKHQKQTPIEIEKKTTKVDTKTPVIVKNILVTPAQKNIITRDQRDLMKQAKRDLKKVVVCFPAKRGNDKSGSNNAKKIKIEK